MNDKNRHLTDAKFTDFPLPEALQSAISDLGYTHCTPIQAKSLPAILDNRNIIGKADTGTGKTATFLIAAIINLLSRTDKSAKALILSPTRELAIQIQKECETLIKYTDLKSVVVYGGADYEKQKQRLTENHDILIGTVGRVIDFSKQKLINLKSFQVMVLDEADRMLDMGFIKDVRYLLKRLPEPENRLNLLFSATINFQVQEFAYELMNDPELISVETKKSESKIEQIGYFVANNEKIALLIGLIKKEAPTRSIVFTNMKVTAEKVTAFLQGNGISAALLSGDVPQKRRESLVKEFGAGKFPVLVATDVAARGLHIDEVSHVFNYDLPQDPEDYVHRIGRTGRIGSSGHAINFICESYAFYQPSIEEFTETKMLTLPVTEDLIAEVAPAVPIERKKNTSRNKQGNDRNKQRQTQSRRR
ncbi:MAG: DEAD/DEAH box helicase [Gammaproteobacteria bacterium]|nr:DEAD/DEAH box helicase [Gammaproteobacteria bacterium]